MKSASQQGIALVHGSINAILDKKPSLAPSTYGVDDRRHLQTMTSPEDDTRTDSVLDMAMEHREAIGSLGSIRLGRRSAPDVPEGATCFLGFVVAGLVGGRVAGAGATFGKGIGFSNPSRPLVGGADSALIRRAGLTSPSLAMVLVASPPVDMFHTINEFERQQLEMTLTVTCRLNVNVVQCTCPLDSVDFSAMA